MAGKMKQSSNGNTSNRKNDRESQTNKKRKQRSSSHKNKNKEAKRAHRGPRLPNALMKEIDSKNSRFDDDSSGGDEETGLNDLYEYEEAFAEEETTKNKRFDPVEDYQYELPDDFKDENIASDEGEDDYEDDGRHGRMLQEITGLPIDVFEDKKKKQFNVFVAPTESENSLSGDILDASDGPISIQDLLEPLHGKPGLSRLKESLRRIQRKSIPIHAPLPKPEQERLERKAAYAHSKKDITKWEPLVKRNREAPTVFFDEDIDLGFSTIGAIASEFEPRTDFEKKMASLVSNNEVVEAHNKDGARLLEFNKISVEEIKNRKDQLAKMRSLLFRHEMKAKRVKKIKSKTYHRLLQKDKRKAELAAYELDPEAAKELARKQEFKRAEERMTLKHKNSSKWARRILERGLDVQDEGTREAFGEQLNKHAALTRKMNSIKESSSSDDSSEYDSDDVSAGSDDDRESKLLMKAKEKMLKVSEADEELPKSGVLSLPFMVRELRKRKEVADEEANAAIEEFESSLKQLEGDKAKESNSASSGRMVFGAPKRAVKETSKKVVKSDNYFGNSDNESDDEANEDEALALNGNNNDLREADIDPSLLHEAFGVNHDSLFKNFENVEDPEPKTNIEVAYLASDSWKKMKKSSGGVKKNENSNIHESKVSVKPQKHDQDLEGGGDDEDDSDSGGEMVDGILSAGAKSSYEIPSQAEIVQRAFAGDDVEEAFEKDKMAVLDEENPEPEKPKVLPGWGQWTDVQKKKGLPSWMLREHETAKRKREESLQKRKDSHLNNVIISEKLDKKAEKLHTKTLPYPYTSKEVFEQSIRMPIGPEFNPASAVGALNRPEVVKKAGVIIKPIRYEDMNIHERAEANKQNGGQKHKKGKDINQSTKKRKTAKV